MMENRRQMILWILFDNFEYIHLNVVDNLIILVLINEMNTISNGKIIKINLTIYCIIK